MFRLQRWCGAAASAGPTGRAGHRLLILGEGVALPLALQILYVIALRFATGLGTGRGTTFSYAYLIAAFLVAITATSIALVATVPFARAGATPERVARHVVATSWISLALVAAAAGFFALAGEAVVKRVLGSSYAGGTGAELGRLVVYLAPWMVASVAVTVAYPLLFVQGRARWLPALALLALLLHVLIEWVLQRAFGLPGVAVGLGAITTLVLVAILHALHAVRRTAYGLAVAAAVCGGLALAAYGLPRLVVGPAPAAVDRPGRVRRRARGLASGRAARRLGLRARIAVAFAAVPARVKQLVRRLGRTGVGKNLIHASVLRDPSTMRFPNVEQWPPDVRGFEDLAFLFSSNQLNHGVASLQIDEAALLYRLARDATSGPFVEIGRFKGGSTFTFASALPQGVELWSYDLHVALRPDMPGDQLDAELRAALERYGIDHKVHLIVADSRKVEPPSQEVELLFIDGDHSYEGARADFDRWSALVRPGGHLLFHDAVDSGGYGNVYPGVSRVADEVGREGGWERQPGAGSIAHFTRLS